MRRTVIKKIEFFIFTVLLRVDEETTVLEYNRLLFKPHGNICNTSHFSSRLCCESEAFALDSQQSLEDTLCRSDYWIMGMLPDWLKGLIYRKMGPLSFNLSIIYHEHNNCLLILSCNSLETKWHSFKILYKFRSGCFRIYRKPWRN